MATTIATAELSKNVTTFLNKPKRMLIGGAWIDSVSGKSFQTYNPAAGEPLARVAEGDRADIDPAVKAARKAFEGGPWPNLSPSDRGRLLWKLADLLEQQLEEFAELESLDNGKPLSVARVADVPLAVDLFRYMAGWTTKIEDNTIPISVSGTKYFAYTLREPVGVVGQIILWNFPLLMAAWKLGPALTAGCTIVMKPPSRLRVDCLAARRADHGSWIPLRSCEHRNRFWGNRGCSPSCPPMSTKSRSRDRLRLAS